MAWFVVLAVAVALLGFVVAALIGTLDGLGYVIYGLYFAPVILVVGVILSLVRAATYRGGS